MNQILNTFKAYCSKHSALERAELFRGIREIMHNTKETVVCSKCKKPFRQLVDEYEPSISEYIPACACNAPGEISEENEYGV